LIYSSAVHHCCPSCGRRDSLYYGSFAKPMSCDYCRAKKGIPMPRPLREVAEQLCKDFIEKRKQAGRVAV
jgi:hypothetical protein